MLITYFVSFTGYGDDIFEVISSLHVQGYKFGGKCKKFGGKSFKHFNSAEFMKFVFLKSVYSVQFTEFSVQLAVC